MAETGLFLEGLRCTGCVNRVEHALRAAAGVHDASLNYTSHRALVGYDPDETTPADLVAIVESLGYEAIPYDPEALDRRAERGAREMFARLLVAAFLALNVMLLSVALYIGAEQDLAPGIRRLLRGLAIVLTVPAVTWCALPFWRGAWSGLRRREITMDLPIVLGVSIAFAVSIAGTLAEVKHLYMDSASMIVFLILLGRTLERRARARAASAVDRLSTLTPEVAQRRGQAGLEAVPVASLVCGDRIVVAPGQRVPVDGRIVAGATEVDEALLTGETRPVLRAPGDPVTGGARNVLAEIEVEVTAALGDGTLARMAELLERAQAQRPRIQRTADRIARIFAPSVIGAGLLVAVGWTFAGASLLDAALATAAVLIVACPCALGLATPAAVTAAIGRAAALGILVKSGDALERCASVDTVLLDKTGTLTEGRFAVEAIVPANGATAATVLAVAAETEGASTHPVAVALRSAAEARGIDWVESPSRRAHAGRGVESGEGARRLRVGSRAFLDEGGVAIDPALGEAGAKLAERGLSLAWVARGAQALGVIGLADPLRADAAEAMSRLRAMGCRVALVSGDHAPAVALAAGRAGITDASAEVRPEQKLRRVEELRKRGHRILMAGDGINDAAALAAADIGVAMARGADVAIHAADVVIRAPRLAALADTIGLARATLRRIRENLGFALAYNAIAIPLAAVGVLEPLQAAIAMSLSSLVVTGNSARLLRWRPR